MSEAYVDGVMTDEKINADQLVKRYSQFTINKGQPSLVRDHYEHSCVAEDYS
jgi:hypothetical protein